MIRTILCPLSGGAGDRAVLEAGGALARRFVAHVEALHARPDAAEMAPYLGEGMSAALIGQIMESAQRRADSQAALAHATFDGWARDSGVAVTREPTVRDVATCAWREEGGALEKWIGRLGRLADIVVVPSAALEPGVGATLAFEAALLDTARPVLLVAARPLAIDGVALIAWNGSAEAARALAAGLPLLAASREVHVVTVEESGRSADPADVVRYLAWHRIAARSRLIAGAGGGAAAAIAAACAESGAGLLVMGGYTHSRLRELIFGGVTAHMIGESAIPVLLAH